jgi:K+-sensing histidine kinase KdpD
VVEGAIRISRTRDGQVPIVIQGSTEPPAVRGDATYIEQVIRNLVTSAARFGGPDSPVVVRLEEAEDEVSVSVLDRGPSPTDDDIRTSFSLSEKPTGRRSWGVGLAMFVCRRLVEAMQGRVWARRRKGGGAEFGFALPRYPITD